MKEIELLAPAGNVETFKAACSVGADAIYMGVDKFNARTMAKNFTIAEYIECIKYAHMRNIKVYLTLNTLLEDSEIKEALNIVLELYSHGLDAVILQDLGLATLIHELLPNFAMHASTQMSIYSLSQVKALENLGFTRVVLARELSIDEIEYIAKNTTLQVEVFVHGALCVSVSGQCLLSSMIGKRSANKGSCAQPCRMKYSLYSKDGEKIKENMYLLSKKDIYGLELLEKLKSAGVYSMKIEGRGKTKEYVSTVVANYRKYLDKVIMSEKLEVDENDKKELIQIFNRSGISTGYLDGVKRQESITSISPKNTGICLGKVIDQKKEFVKVKLDENVDMHDGIEIYSDGNVISSIVTCIRDDKFKITNKEGKAFEYVWLGDIKGKAKFGSVIYKTSSEKLNKKYASNIAENNVTNPIIYDLEIKIVKGNNISVVAKSSKNTISCSIDEIPQIAISKPTNKQNVINSFSKTQDLPFKFQNVCVEIDEDVFVPISVINELRRELVKKLEESYEIKIDIECYMNKLDRLLELKKNEKSKENKEKQKGSVMNSLYIYRYSPNTDYEKLYREKFGKKLERIDIPFSEYVKYKEKIERIRGIEIYVTIPNVVLGNYDKLIKENIAKLGDEVKGIILGNIGYIELLKDIKIKKEYVIVADYSLNATNRYTANALKNLGFDIITPSTEMTADRIKDLGKYVDLEIVADYITVLTSRYCILGSFVSKSDNKCDKSCTKKDYYLADSYSYKYDIVCDNLDCIMHLVRKIQNADFGEMNMENVVSIRRCIV